MTYSWLYVCWFLEIFAILSSNFSNRKFPIKIWKNCDLFLKPKCVEWRVSNVCTSTWWWPTAGSHCADFRTFSQALSAFLGTKNFIGIFCFFVETQLFKTACIKYVHFIPVMAYSLFQLCWFSEISASIKCDFACQKSQIKCLGKNVLWHLYRKAKKTIHFYGKYFVNGDPPAPYCSYPWTLINVPVTDSAMSV